MEVVKPITEILQGTNLVLAQSTRFQWWKAEFSDTLGGITRSKEPRGMGMYPGTETGERSQMIVNRGVSQAIRESGHSTLLHI